MNPLSLIKFNTRLVTLPREATAWYLVLTTATPSYSANLNELVTTIAREALACDAPYIDVIRTVAAKLTLFFLDNPTMYARLPASSWFERHEGSAVAAVVALVSDYMALLR